MKDEYYLDQMYGESSNEENMDNDQTTGNLYLFEWEKKQGGYSYHTTDRKYACDMRWATDVYEEFAENLLDKGYWMPTVRLEELKAAVAAEEPEYNAWLDEMSEKDEVQDEMRWLDDLMKGDDNGKTVG